MKTKVLIALTLGSLTIGQLTGFAMKPLAMNSGAGGVSQQQIREDKHNLGQAKLKVDRLQRDFDQAKADLNKIESMGSTQQESNGVTMPKSSQNKGAAQQKVKKLGQDLDNAKSEYEAAKKKLMDDQAKQ